MAGRLTCGDASNGVSLQGNPCERNLYLLPLLSYFVSPSTLLELVCAYSGLPYCALCGILSRLTLFSPSLLRSGVVHEYTVVSIIECMRFLKNKSVEKREKQS